MQILQWTWCICGCRAYIDNISHEFVCPHCLLHMPADEYESITHDPTIPVNSSDNIKGK